MGEERFCGVLVVVERYGGGLRYHCPECDRRDGYVVSWTNAAPPPGRRCRRVVTPPPPPLDTGRMFPGVLAVLLLFVATLAAGCTKTAVPPPAEVAVPAGGLEVCGDYIISAVQVAYGEKDRESHAVTRALTEWLAQHGDLKVVSVTPCRMARSCGDRGAFVTVIQELVILAYRPRGGEAER